MAAIDNYLGVWPRNYNPTDGEVENGTGAIAGATHSGSYPSGQAISQLLTGLADNTDYDIEWFVRDADSNTARGVTAQFTTLVAIATPNPTSVQDVGTGLPGLAWGYPAYIIGTDFGTTQGASAISLEDSGATEVTQTATAWSDTQITFTPTQGALTGATFTIHVDRN